MDSDDEINNPKKLQNQKVFEAVSKLSTEQRERLNFFRSQSCRLPIPIVKKIMDDNSPEGVSIQKAAAVHAAQAARFFAAELVETARRLSTEIGPLTPDLILIAYSYMAQQRKIPGNLSGVPSHDKRV